MLSSNDANVSRMKPPLRGPSSAEKHFDKLCTDQDHSQLENINLRSKRVRFSSPLPTFTDGSSVASLEL